MSKLGKSLIEELAALRKERDDYKRGAAAEARQLYMMIAELNKLRKERDEYREALEGAMHTIFAINGSVDVSIKAVLAKYKEKP